MRILLAEKKTRTQYIIEKLIPLAVKRGNLELVKVTMTLTSTHYLLNSSPPPLDFNELFGGLNADGDYN